MRNERGLLSWKPCLSAEGTEVVEMTNAREPRLRKEWYGMGRWLRIRLRALKAERWDSGDLCIYSLSSVTYHIIIEGPWSPRRGDFSGCADARLIVTASSRVIRRTMGTELAWNATGGHAFSGGRFRGRGPVPRTVEGDRHVQPKPYTMGQAIRRNIIR